jgi:hypothetical protein
VREKADTFQVENPKEGMQKFESLLGKLLKVPKSEIEPRKRNPKSGKPKRKKAR